MNPRILQYYNKNGLILTEYRFTGKWQPLKLYFQVSETFIFEAAINN